MKKEFIFLIDVNLNNFPRDLFKVSSNLNKLNNQFSFICIYDDYESKDLIEKITRQFPKNYLFIRSKPNAKFIQQLFEEYKPVASINMAHRIFDMTYNFFSKEYIGIKNLIAEIKEDNVASQKTFLGIGFTKYNLKENVGFYKKILF